MTTPRDRFAAYSRSPGGPYSDIVALLPGDAEFEPTSAIWINAPCYATVLPHLADQPVTLRFDEPGELRIRIRGLLAVLWGSYGVDGYMVYTPGLVGDFPDPDPIQIPLILGLY